MFSEFGAIISSKVVLDPVTGKSKGSGFVKFSSVEEAEGAIDGLNGQVFESSLRLSSGLF